MQSIHSRVLDRKASNQVCILCKTEASWWCLDCFAGKAYCTECCWTSHCRDPFHRIEWWTGTFFELSWLWKVGLVIRLSHNSDRCPDTTNHFDAELDIDEEWFDTEDIPSTSADPKPPDRVYNGGRVMTIVHTSGVHYLPIVFCRCSGAAAKDIQLLRAGLYPSTYKSCQTVFAFQLLDDYLLENLECKTSATHYYSKLRRVTNFVFPNSIPVWVFKCGATVSQNLTEPVSWVN